MLLPIQNSREASPVLPGSTFLNVVRRASGPGLGCALVLAGLSVGPVEGREEPAVEAIAQFVLDLSHDDYERRENATRLLQTWAPAGYALVLEAALGDDPEASVRATNVLVAYADTFDGRVVRPVVNALKKSAEETGQPSRARRAATFLSLMIGAGARHRSGAHLANLGLSIEPTDDNVQRLALGEDWVGRDRSLRHLARFSELRSLDISRSKVGDTALAVLPSLPNLEKLYIGRTAIGGPGLARLKTSPGLTYLSLEGLKIGDKEMAHVAGLARLEHLGIDFTNVTDAALDHVVELKRLQTLWLNGAAIEGPGLARLQGLPKLNKLVLAKSSFGDAGMPYLAKLDQLKLLGLEGTSITDAGAAHLASLVNLEELWLNETALSDKSISALAKLKSLKNLHLPGSKLTAAGISRLRSLLPECEIESE